MKGDLDLCFWCLPVFVVVAVNVFMVLGWSSEKLGDFVILWFSRVAALSREHGIGREILASDNAIKSSPVPARFVGGNATFAARGTGALLREDEVEKNDCGGVSVCVGADAFSRASLRAFIFSACWTSARIAGSSVGVRDAKLEKCVGDYSFTFVC